MALRTVQRSFGGGELTGEFFGQIGDAKYSIGLAVCRNFTVLPHGPAANRPGFGFVRATKGANGRARLLPFTYSTTQTMVLEVGHHYIRFHTAGATLVDGGGVPYEVTTDYDVAHLFDIHYTQSADVLTLVHPLYPPRERRRLGALSWSLVDIDFTSNLDAPTGVSATATTGTGTTDYVYKVVSVGANGIEKSLASSSTTVAN